MFQLYSDTDQTTYATLIKNDDLDNFFNTSGYEYRIVS